MAMFDNATFRAPVQPVTDIPSVGDIMAMRNARDQQQMEFQKNLEYQRHVQGLNNLVRQNTVETGLAKPTVANTGAPNTSGMNTVFRDYIDPYKRAQLDQDAAKIELQKQNNMAKNNIAQQNTDIKKETANDSNYIQAKTEGGDIITIDKKTGKMVDTGVKNGTMTQSDALGAKSDAAIKLEGKKEEGRNTNIKTRGAQLIDQIHAKGEEARKTRGTATAYSPSNLPTQQIKAQQLRANDFKNKNPELGKFITIDPNTGMVNVAAASNGIFGFGASGPTEAQRQQILSAIGQQPTTASSTVPSGNTTVTDKPATSAPAGKVRVRLPNGQTGYMDPQHATQPGVTIIDPGTPDTSPTPTAQLSNVPSSNFAPQMTNLIGPWSK